MSSPDFLEWALRGIVGAMVAAVVGLFTRLRSLENKRAAADEKISVLEKRGTGAADVKELRDELHGLRLCIAKNYITREDWVPAMSRVMGALEKQGEMLARVDERQQQQQGREGRQ